MVPQRRRRLRVGAALARMPTGAKLFLILSVTLLFPALIVLGATLQTTRTADAETRARLRVAASESSRATAIELVGDMTALRVALNALDADPADAPSCARAQGVLASLVASRGGFAVTDRAGGVLCGTGLDPALRNDMPRGSGPMAAKIVVGRGLLLAIDGGSGTTRAAAFFPVAVLAEVGKPSGYITDYASRLTLGDQSLDISGHEPPFARREHIGVPIGLADLVFEMSVPSAPITSAILVSMLLPLFMWLAAASAAWFVVDRLLIRPLQRLRRSVAGYVPGEVIDIGEVRAIPAQEIRELGATFRTISRTVALHEAGLAEGLVRQTRLTREVHHRVKNNLQVISSLINLHARAARTDEASEAYSSIQRRVDALAVVHRNHFAEMEENRGLNVRTMIGELASNLRATAPERLSKLGITLDIRPYLVNQDVAVAIAFILTELVELATVASPAAQIHLTVKPGESEASALLRVSSPSLIESETLTACLATRYGRVLDGLSRQLRSRLHHDPLTGAFEIAIPVIGQD